MGPLHELCNVELEGIGPVPMCATLRADLGADVVRIDRHEPNGLGLALDMCRTCDRAKPSAGIGLRIDHA